MYFKFYSEFELKNDIVYKNDSFLRELPETGVMFVSSCENYQMDTMLLYRRLMLVADHSFLNPKTNISALLPSGTFSYMPETKALKYLNCIPHPVGEDSDISNFTSLRACVRALQRGWLLSYPSPVGENTTLSVHESVAPFIKRIEPVVVPIHICGTMEAFGNTTSSIHNEPKKIEVTFKDPLKIDYSEHPEVISAQISCSTRSSK